MNLIKLLKTLFLVALLIFASFFGNAQQPAADTSSKKQIFILNSRRLTYQKIDTAEFQSAAGNVIIRQQNTMFYCDSVVLNKTLNMLESFGHVHINDADSVQIYSDYLKYTGNDKRAYLKGNVKLTDNKGVLTTTDLVYEVNNKIGTYTNGGKVVNDKTVLNSKEGYYYGETRDVYFKKNVVLINPDYTVKTDTLLYNTYTEVSTFVVPTEITSGKNRKIFTSDGYYDLKNKRAYFGKRPQIQDSTTFLIADEVASDDSSGFGEARGNVIYNDTAQHVMIFSNNLKSNQKAGSFLATEKPVMMIKQEQDSIYIAADTLYSARLSDLRKSRSVPVIVDSMAKPSSVKNNQQAADSQVTNGSPAISNDLPVAGSESLIAHNDLPAGSDSIVVQNELSVGGDSLVAGNDVSAGGDLSTAKSDSLIIKNTVQTSTDSTDRFFEAYYNVKIFSDSLQAAGDSLFYSGEDSAFRLFKNPIVWAQENQITGDTIYLFTHHKKPERLYVFENALAINKLGTNYYNQIKGRTINGYFKEGNIDYMRAKGNAESIYYAQDENDKFIGVNRATSDVIDMYFEDKKAQRVVFRVNLNGTTYPMRQINHDELRLRGFNWLDELRPKTKYDLFGN